MHRFLVTVAVIALSTTVALAQTPAGKPAVAKRARAKAPPIEFETMTWPEVKQALAEGKTTALFYTGGTEQRGPQNANGGHNLMAKATVKAIALKLGDAIAMPVLPYTPNNASAQIARHDRIDQRDPRRDSRANQRPGDPDRLQEYDSH